MTRSLTIDRLRNRRVATLFVVTLYMLGAIASAAPAATAPLLAPAPTGQYQLDKSHASLQL
jgi:hypothetical protein